MHILTGGWSGSFQRLTVAGIVLHRYGRSLTPHLVLPVVIRKTRPDIIIDDLAHVVPWGSSLLSDISGVVFFRHLHRRTLKGQTNRWLAVALTAIERVYPWAYSRWTFVTETDGSIDDLVELGVDRNRCVRIPPGVDSTRFTPGPKAVCPSLLYFGGMKEYKRPDHALTVLINLRKIGVNCRLLFIGEGPSLSRLRRLVRISGLRDSVSFLGRLSDDELSRLIPSCHVNLHCSVAEGWGHSILEAAAAGVPTAGYRVPGVRESVIDGKTGLLATDGDIRGLTECVLHLLETSEQWTTRCREHALDFSWDISVDRWEMLFKQIY